MKKELIFSDFGDEKSKLSRTRWRSSSSRSPMDCKGQRAIGSLDDVEARGDVEVLMAINGSRRLDEKDEFDVLDYDGHTHEIMDMDCDAMSRSS